MCKSTIRFPEDYVGSERRRGFQPPWYTVLKLKCPECGAIRYLKQNWHGPDPRFGIKCD